MAQALGARQRIAVGRRFDAVVNWARGVRPRLDELLPWLVLALAALSAILFYASYLDVAALRWGSVGHDRNAHYLLGLRLATDIRNLDFIQYARDFDSGSRIWPPLHGMLLSIVLLIGGPDHRLAVLPSLAGWIGMVYFGFLLARRIVPRYGNSAGLAATLFLIASPAHRAYATDIMLESLGACLTLAALYVYVCWAENESIASRYGLPVVLTLLFLTKYNFWVLVVLTIAGAEFTRRPGEHFRRWVAICRSVNWRLWLSRQIRRPLNYGLLALVGLMSAIWLSGGWTWNVAGRPIEMRTNINLITFAYAIVLLRMIGWWRNGGRDWMRERFGAKGVAFVYWHLVPVSVWFLMPQHLWWFLWYSSPANAGEAPFAGGWSAGAAFYRQGMALDYHTSAAAAAIASGMALIAILTLIGGRFRNAGLSAVAFFIVLGGMLLLNHPNKKFRFLHTWLPVFWIVAAVGFAMLLDGLGRLRLPVLPAGCSVAGLIALGMLLSPAINQRGYASESNLNASGGSWRDVTDAYLPYLDDSRQPAVLSNMPVKFVATWSYLERFRRADTLKIDLREADNYAPATEEGFRSWIEITKCDTIVYIDVKPDGRFYEPAPPSESNAVVGQLLPTQSVFRLAATIDFPKYGCTVTIWRKRS